MCPKNHNNNNKSTTISPVVSSGFARRRVPIVASILGLAIFYNGVCWFLKDSVSVKGDAFMSSKQRRFDHLPTLSFERTCTRTRIHLAAKFLVVIDFPCLFIILFLIFCNYRSHRPNRHNALVSFVSACIIVSENDENNI